MIVMDDGLNGGANDHLLPSDDDECYECGSTLDDGICIECAIREEKEQAAEERDRALFLFAVLAVLMLPTLFAAIYVALTNG